MKKGGFSGPFQPRRPHSRLRLGERHRLLQQELARECREVQLLEGSLARLRAAHTGGGGGSAPSPMPLAPALVLGSERQPRAMLPSPSPLPSPEDDSQPWALPPSPRPYTPPGYHSQIVPVVAPLPIRAHESPSRRRPQATAAAAEAAEATAKWRDVEASALQPGHVPLSSLPLEGVTAILRHAGLHLYAEGFTRLGVDGEMLAVRGCWCISSPTERWNPLLNLTFLSYAHKPYPRTPRCARRT